MFFDAQRKFEAQQDQWRSGPTGSYVAQLMRQYGAAAPSGRTVPRHELLPAPKPRLYGYWSRSHHTQPWRLVCVRRC